MPEPLVGRPEPTPLLTPKRLNAGRPLSTREYAEPDPSKTTPERGMVTYPGELEGGSGVEKLAPAMESSGAPDVGSAEYTKTLTNAVSAVVAREAAITSDVRENVPGPHTAGSDDWNAKEIAYSDAELTSVRLDALVRIGAVEPSVPSNTAEKMEDPVGD